MRVSGKNLSLIIDTNVWIDYFMRSEVDAGASERLLEAAILSETTLLVCPTTLKDVFYILPRRFRQQDMREGKAGPSYEPVAWACVERILELATPTPLGLFECTMARSLRDKFGDLEDNLVLGIGRIPRKRITSSRAMPRCCNASPRHASPPTEHWSSFHSERPLEQLERPSQNGWQLGYVPNCTISCERGGRTPCVRRPTIEPEGGVPRAKLGFSKCPILTRKRGAYTLGWRAPA